ncbi:eae-like domain protein [Escherichia coli]|uniref:eae-like domain protein n=1 Tax=Escherichia coli TaxID=562 RepID=UPI00041EE7C0|nr:eae-like domain protein [Escherichia coli]MCN8099031.1 eae-like domain protein [Escherichia coli]MCO4979421.1 eae-like domain protein [Escherichia coli]MDA5675719.1 eae-like domain protein [Escherichia coli]MDF1104233.1 eae-like domain protein [Escherichia coli]MDF1181447.1 eae-like domain protein [Escherichia coli]
MAEGMIKDLVASGHALADDMTGAPSVLVRCLAAQLEVQLVRANELAEDHQRAIESIKQADAAVKLAHEKFSTLAAENAGLKAICDDRRRFIMNGVQMGYIKVPAAETDPDLETIRIAISPQKPIPATDAFLSEVRAQGVDAAIEAAKNLVAQEYEYKDFKAAQSDCCMHPGSDLVGKVEMTEWLVDFAAQLRKGGTSERD